jgi:hypothetical protein
MFTTIMGEKCSPKTLEIITEATKTRNLPTCHLVVVHDWSDPTSVIRGICFPCLEHDVNMILKMPTGCINVGASKTFLCNKPTKNRPPHLNTCTLCTKASCTCFPIARPIASRDANSFILTLIILHHGGTLKNEPSFRTWVAKFNEDISSAKADHWLNMPPQTNYSISPELRDNDCAIERPVVKLE